MAALKPLTSLEILLIAIILATLGLMLIPTYRNFTAAAKLTVAKGNCQAATAYLGAELSKKMLAPELASPHLIADLNQTQKSNPYDPRGVAAAYGAALTPGSVRISPDDLRAAQPGEQIIVECEWTGDRKADGVYRFQVQ